MGDKATGLGAAGYSSGKIAGLRLAVAELRKWAERAAEESGATSIAAVTLEDAADNFDAIADRLEEEG